MINKIKNIIKRFSRYELVAFTTGFILMSYELIASRILGPAIGSSLYVWTAVIGVIILALAIGYTVGGYIADKRINTNDVAIILLISALFILLNIFSYHNILDFISTNITDSRTQAVVATVILFMPPSFLLGMVSPYLARLRIKSINKTGQSLALLSASNSIGGILGTFITGFIFFAYLNINQGLTLLILILLISSLLMTKKLYKKQLVFSVFILLIAIMIFIIKTPASYVQYDTEMSSYKIKYTNIDQREISLLVMGPGGYQSGSYVDGNKDLIFPYTNKIADLVKKSPQKKDILILGGGAYSLPEYLAKEYPRSNITVVEIDGELEQIAKDHFRYEPEKNIRNITQDARVFLNNNEQKYDIVIVDIYSDSSVPFSLTTLEYSNAIFASANKGASIIANVIGSSNGGCSLYFNSLDNSYKKNFRNVKYFPIKKEL